MGGLLGLLDLGAGALAAQNVGVSVAGRNAANVNTEGYSRERADLESELAAPLVGGVRASGPSRAEDAILSLRERAASGARGRADALAAALGGLERDLAGSGDVVHAIGELFGGLSSLAASPMD